MALDLVAEIERLTRQREEAAQVIATIDQQLARVRAAIGLPTFGQPSRVNGHHYVRARHTSAAHRQAVLDALTKQEPLRVDILKERTGLAGAGHIAALMAKAGTLARRRGHSTGLGSPPFWYARSEGAFANHPDTDPANHDLSDESDEVG